VFSAIAIATLALGIGGITAMFSAVDAVLIRPLAYADADRLVMIWDDLHKSGDLPKHFPTPAEWLEWRRHNTVFTDLAATQPGAAMLSGDSEPEQVQARKATGNLWHVLGVKPLIGRVFTEEEDQKNVSVVVISYGLWQRRYGGSPDVLGRKITINDNPCEVIGVMPREFYFLPARDIDIWMPASFPAWMLRSFGWHDEQVVARLKPAVTLEHARESMAALSRQVTAAKDSTGPHSVIVTPLREDLTGKTQTALVLLLCASAALLLIACVNLANLLLSRGVARGREVAVRVALGAGGPWNTGRATPYEEPGACRTRCRRRTGTRRTSDAISGNACSGDYGYHAAHARLACAGVFRLRSHCRNIDLRTCASAARVAVRPTGRAARRGTGHCGPAQPLVPAFADCRRDSACRRAVDERRPVAPDPSASPQHGSGTQKRKAADL
jgi:hypothetical protein